MNNTVLFFNEQSDWKVREKGKIKTWINKIFKGEKAVQGNINIILCSDSYLLELNKQYLGRNYLTDIITFPVSSEDEISGDLYISTDRIEENAAKYKIDHKSELLRVIAHGILHLNGYNDNTKDEIKVMRGKEDYYLKLFVPESD